MKSKIWIPVGIAILSALAGVIVLSQANSTHAANQALQLYLPLIRRNPLTIVTSCPSLITRPDAFIVADSILHRQTQEPLPDPDRRTRLILDVELMLSRIRNRDPALADVHARESYQAGQLVVSMDPALRATVESIIGNRSEPIVFRTGNQAFDNLNRRLSLRGLELRSSFTYFCFDDELNLPVAATAYSELEEILNAEPAHLIGDGPDLDALLDGDTWYVVFRDAWGDCLAGCTHEDLFFFTVTGDEVAAVETAQAMSDPRFSELLALVRP